MLLKGGGDIATPYTFICLEVSCSQQRVMLGSICLSALSRSFPPAIYCVIIFLSFFLIVLGSSFHSDSFCLTLILTKDLSLGTDNKNLEKDTVLIFRIQFSYQSIKFHNTIQNENILTLCLFGEIGL